MGRGRKSAAGGAGRSDLRASLANSSNPILADSVFSAGGPTASKEDIANKIATRLEGDRRRGTVTDAQEREVANAMKELGAKQIETPGQNVEFNGRTMSGATGSFPGDPVTVVRPGYEVNGVLKARATVKPRTATPSTKTAPTKKAAPTKRASTKAAPARKVAGVFAGGLQRRARGGATKQTTARSRVVSETTSKLRDSARGSLSGGSSARAALRTRVNTASLNELKTMYRGVFGEAPGSDQNSRSLKSALKGVANL